MVTFNGTLKLSIYLITITPLLLLASEQVILDTPNGVLVHYERPLSDGGRLVANVAVDECKGTSKLSYCHRAHFIFGEKGAVSVFYVAPNVDADLDSVLLALLVSGEIEFTKYNSVEYFKKATLLSLMPNNISWRGELDKHGEDIAIFGAFPPLNEKSGFLDVRMVSPNQVSTFSLPYFPDL